MINSIEKEILIDVLNNPNDTFYENVFADFLDEQGIDHDFRKPLHNNHIAELKPYQEKCLDIWANYWISVVLCTRQTDESKVEQCFYDFYKELGFPKFESIVWFNNPIDICNRAANLYKQVYDPVCDQVLNYLRKQLKKQVWVQMLNQAGNLVWNQIVDRLKNKVCDQVNSLFCQINDKVWSRVRNHHAWNNIYQQIWDNQHDIYWLAYYTYMMQVLRMEAPKQFVPFMLLAQEINWWFLLEKTVFVTRKPKEFVFKDRKLVKLVCQDNYTIT
jgi:hypothetical protein